MFKDPRKDRVYRVANKLFEADTPYNLSGSQGEGTGRDLATGFATLHTRVSAAQGKGFNCRRRDELEWIVDCAKRAKADVVIVSRDGDFEVRLEGDLTSTRGSRRNSKNAWG